MVNELEVSFKNALSLLREVENQCNAKEPFKWHGERIRVWCLGDGVGGDCESSLYRHPCEGHKLKTRIEEFNKLFKEE